MTSTKGFFRWRNWIFPRLKMSCFLRRVVNCCGSSLTAPPLVSLLQSLRTAVATASASALPSLASSVPLLDTDRSESPLCSSSDPSSPPAKPRRRKAGAADEHMLLALGDAAGILLLCNQTGSHRLLLTVPQAQPRNSRRWRRRATCSDSRVRAQKSHVLPSGFFRGCCGICTTTLTSHFSPRFYPFSPLSSLLSLLSSPPPSCAAVKSSVYVQFKIVIILQVQRCSLLARVCEMLKTVPDEHGKERQAVIERYYSFRFCIVVANVIAGK